eukprot:scaffold37731_cov67-Phaeocystis_antarctica.AAC.1
MRSTFGDNLIRDHALDPGPCTVAFPQSQCPPPFTNAGPDAPDSTASVQHADAAAPCTVPCSTPAPDNDAGDLDGEDRRLCTVKPRVTTLPLVYGQVAGGNDRRPRRATLASPRGRQTGVRAARARSLLCTWCAWMVGLFPEPWVAHSGTHGGRAV